MNQIGPLLPSGLLRPMSDLLAAQSAAPRPAASLTTDIPPLTLDNLAPPSVPQASAQSQLAFVQPALIGPGDRVLHIGDSHTAGIYGKEMDKLLRGTGAKVETYGSSSSRPSWFLNGYPTTWGFFGKDENGVADIPKNWKDPHPTPKLPDLIGRFHPNVIMISLGANLLGSNGDNIEKEVRQLADVAKASGAKIIWVGPPDGVESKKPTSKQASLYQHLEKVARQYGDFIDSRPMTEYPVDAEGKPLGDGVHYNHNKKDKTGKGAKIAMDWTKEVFRQIQALQP